MLWGGLDKAFVYDASHYHLRNAYVGGDGYNFIINSNYTVAFFVLAVGFFLAATIMLATSYVISVIQEANSFIDKEDVPKI